MWEKYNINQTTLKIISKYLNNYQKSLHLRELSRSYSNLLSSIQLWRTSSRCILSPNLFYFTGLLPNLPYSGRKEGGS